MPKEMEKMNVAQHRGFNFNGMTPTISEKIFRQNQMFQSYITGHKLMVTKVSQPQKVQVEGESPVEHLKCNYMDQLFNKSMKSSLLMTMVASVLIMGQVQPAEAKIIKYTQRNSTAGYHQSYFNSKRHADFGRTRDHIG